MHRFGFQQLPTIIRWLCYTIDGFLFLEPCKERLYSCQVHLFTQLSDNVPGCLVTSHINAVRCFFQIKDKNSWRINDSWGLHRPPDTVCSGTGRPVCQFGDLGTAPTTEHCVLGTGRPVCQFGDLGTAPTTEHCVLGDWSTSLPVWRSGDCTDHRALCARGLVDQSSSLEIWGLTNH